MRGWLLSLLVALAIWIVIGVVVVATMSWAAGPPENARATGREHSMKKTIMTTLMLLCCALWGIAQQSDPSQQRQSSQNQQSNANQVTVQGCLAVRMGTT